MRDHLLGFPPALLALDPEPPKPDGRTPLRARVTAAEQAERLKLDTALQQARQQFAEMKAQSDAIAEKHGIDDCAGQAPAMATSGSCSPPVSTPDPALPTGTPEGAMWVCNSVFWRWDVDRECAEYLMDGRWVRCAIVSLSDIVADSSATPIPGARIPHDGGPCPVPPETRIARWWMKDGDEGDGLGAAALVWDWAAPELKAYEGRRIVAYEVAP